MKWWDRVVEKFAHSELLSQKYILEACSLEQKGLWSRSEFPKLLLVGEKQLIKFKLQRPNLCVQSLPRTNSDDPL